jgi:hypothetical protein
MGAFAYGSVISDRGSGKIFNAGFGYGHSASLFSSSSMDTIDAGISLSEGISILIYLKREGEE